MQNGIGFTNIINNYNPNSQYNAIIIIHQEKGEGHNIMQFIVSLGMKYENRRNRKRNKIEKRKKLW